MFERLLRDEGEEWQLFFVFKGDFPTEEELRQCDGLVVTGSVCVGGGRGTSDSVPLTGRERASGASLKMPTPPPGRFCQAQGRCVWAGGLAGQAAADDPAGGGAGEAGPGARTAPASAARHAAHKCFFLQAFQPLLEGGEEESIERGRAKEARPCPTACTRRECALGTKWWARPTAPAWAGRASSSAARGSWR